MKKNNMRLSHNLTLSEMTKSSTAQRKGLDNSPTTAHITHMVVLAAEIFQPIREHFNKPLYISSGYRSKALNKAIGGSTKSQHSRGQAIDIDMDNRDGPTNREIFDFIADNLDFDQLIWEFGTDKDPNWVHVSYNPDLSEQRNRILRAIRTNGRTTYEEIT